MADQEQAKATMMTINFNRYSRRGLKNALLAGVFTGLTISTAIAQGDDQGVPLKMRSSYLGYAAGVSTQVTYTDNINLSRDGFKDGELITSAIFSGGAIFSTPRVTGLVLGDLDFSFLVDSGEFQVSQDIGATSTFTAADNWLYFDLSGQTSRQLLGEGARFARNINTGRSQQVNVHSYAASPYIYHQMADRSAVELRYRFSQLFVPDSANFNSIGGGALSDAATHEATASYESGAKFDRFRFGVTGYANETRENGRGSSSDFDYQQAAVSANAQVALSTKFSLSGAFGYDEIDTENAASRFFNDDDLSGVFWRAGFIATPNRRSRIRLEYGQRYDDDFIDADVFYELSQRLAFSAGASRQFVTRAQGINAQFRGVQTQTLDFADRLRAGQELSPAQVIESANRFSSTLSNRSSTTIGVAVRDNAFAALVGSYGRNSISLSGRYSDSDFGFRQVQTHGASLEFTREISRRTSANAGIDWCYLDSTIDGPTCLAVPFAFGLDPLDPMFDPVTQCASLVANNGISDTFIGRVGASHRLYQNVSAFAELAHSKRFSENVLLEYDETSATVGLKLDF
ncbi:MAG: hypothetical protein HKN14_10000 [Marinicaulis sp.]|nr:hypothetical protein [Marinicaulis sp.]